MENSKGIREQFKNNENKMRLKFYAAAAAVNFLLLPIILFVTAEDGSMSLAGLAFSLLVSGVLYYLSGTLSYMIAFTWALFGLAVRIGSILGGLLFFLPGFGLLVSYGIGFAVVGSVFLFFVFLFCLAPCLCIPVLVKLADAGILYREGRKEGQASSPRLAG